MNLLRGLTLLKCERYRRECNFTEDERAVFDLCTRNRSRLEIAEALKMSISTVDRRIHEVKLKIEKVRKFYDEKTVGS